jgi:tRNA U34 5-methylaminomethyl-2-thiouridine-forming methyltransferase MnmC
LKHSFHKEFIIEFIKTDDGSNTLFSQEYNQHYHSCRDGALYESLSKHIMPALHYQNKKEKLVILDICFGLGYNTFATLYYLKKNHFKKKLHIYSPELDEALVKSLKEFVYPDELRFCQLIVQELSKNFFYEDNDCTIEIINKDAREVLKELKRENITFDIVYQDPFSSEVNKSLWTVEYFDEIEKLLAKDGIVTTYSIATPVRLSMYESGLDIYEIEHEKRKSTLGFKKSEKKYPYKYIDMELKKQRNTKAKALRDKG